MRTVLVWHIDRRFLHCQNMSGACFITLYKCAQLYVFTCQHKPSKHLPCWPSSCYFCFPTEDHVKDCQFGIGFKTLTCEIATTQLLILAINIRNRLAKWSCFLTLWLYCGHFKLCCMLEVCCIGGVFSISGTDYFKYSCSGVNRLIAYHNVHRNVSFLISYSK